MPKLDMNAVADLWNHYHNRTRDDLYAHEGRIVVHLPEGLKDFCNAAAGTSSYPAHIPIGISRTTNNPKQTLKSIFATIDSLTSFIMSSECNGQEYAKTLRKKALAKSKGVVVLNKTHNMPADTLAPKFWGPTIYVDLAEKYGRDAVLQARKFLTINEFALRFGLELPESKKVSVSVPKVNYGRVQERNKTFKRFGTK